MRSESTAAFVGGVTGAAAMMLASRISRTRVVPTLERVLRGDATAPHLRMRRRAGVMAQLVNGGLLAQGYIAALRWTGLRAGWKNGMALGVLHGAAAASALAEVPAGNGSVPNGAPHEPRMLNDGLDRALALVALHGLFGAVVGASISRLQRMT